MSLDELRLNYNMNCFICYQSNVFLNLDDSSLFSNKVHLFLFHEKFNQIRLEFFWSKLMLQSQFLPSAQASILNLCKIAKNKLRKSRFSKPQTPLLPPPSDIRSLFTYKFRVVWLISWNQAHCSPRVELDSSPQIIAQTSSRPSFEPGY